MAAKKKIRKNAFRGVVLFGIIPLLVINSYAYWQLSETAASYHVQLFGSMSDNLTQLAVILAINSLVIIFLLIYISTSRK